MPGLPQAARQGELHLHVEGIDHAGQGTLTRKPPAAPAAGAGPAAVVLQAFFVACPPRRASEIQPASARGRRIVTTVPSPEALRTATSPWCSSTMRLTIASPSPLPPPSASPREPDPVYRRSNRCSRSCAAIPLPLSATCTHARPSSADARSVTRPPDGVCFSALSNRLASARSN